MLTQADSLLEAEQDSAAYHIYHQVFRLSDNEVDDVAFVKAAIGLDKFHYWYTNYDSSVYYIQQYIPVAIRLGDQNRIRGGYNNLGLSYMLLGYFSGAIENLKKGLQLAEEAQDKRRMALAYNNIGLVYHTLVDNQHQSAFENYRKSIELKKQLNLPLHRLSTTYFNLGGLFYIEGNTDSLRHYATLMDQLCANTAHDQTCFDAKFLKIDLLILEKDWEALNPYIAELKKLEKIPQESIVYQDILSALLNYYSEKNDLEAAYPYMLKLIQNEEMSIPHTYASHFTHMENLVDYHQTIGQLDSALYYKNKQTEWLQEKLNSNVNLAFGDLKMTTMSVENREALEIKDRNIIRQKWIIAMLILGSTLLALSIFIFYRNRQQQQRERLDSELVRAELKALRMQINPHFIFNALASIQRYILKNDAHKANDFLTKFSRYIRKILISSDQLVNSLDDELAVLLEYLRIESIRLGESFDFQIQVEESVVLQEWNMPSILLQTFAENAIWHGLMPKKELGHLEVRVTSQQTSCLIEVEDNGIGRSGAKSRDTRQNHKSKGLSMVEEKIQLFNRQRPYESINFEIEDLFTEDKTPSGTRVKIQLQRAR